jgi:hypothetical protein
MRIARSRVLGALWLASPAAFVANVGCGGDDSNASSGDGGANGDGSTTGDGGTNGDGATSGDGGNNGDGATSGDGAASCLGSSLLAALGKDHLMVGGAMADTTASTTPIGVRYEYLSGGLFDGDTPCTSCATGCTTNGTTCANSGPGCAWWGCWQYDQDPPGAYARGFVTKAIGATPKQIPMFTYYQILNAGGAAEGAPEVQATTNVTLMRRYFNDWRFLLNAIGQNVALLHIEPDFWGYAEQINSNPHSIASAVATANPTDCSAMENSIAGMGKCMIAMVRKYAPNAKVGLHASGWGTNMDVLQNTSATFDVAGEARKLAAFVTECGATDGDFITVEASDRDAGYYQSIGKMVWWDATNATLPNFHQDFAWATALTEALGKPALWWQIPLGNMQLGNVNNQWKDNRVDYYFAHMNEVAAAHGVGVAYGAGAGGQTTPETDNGNFVTKVKAYEQSGGTKLCGP